MKRYASLEEISDGKLYSLNDMVKADCGDCKNCSACCHEMADSVVLDPYDVYRLQTGLHLTFEQLAGYIDFHVETGLILPHLKTTGDDYACVYLNREGRCSIHSYRPGICRLFPLGRYYENDTFQYFLQIHECVNKKRMKIKVKKWIDTPNVAEYETYIMEWHKYIVWAQSELARFTVEEQKVFNMEHLTRFYMTPYQTEDFYEEFYQRLKTMRAK